MNNEPRPETIAEQLAAIGHYMNDNAQSSTPTGDTFILAAKYLRKLGMNMCGDGIVGCHGGPECKSDHK